MSSPILPLLLLTAATPVIFALWNRYTPPARGRLPPGPKGYPVIVNIYNAPHEKAWLEYEKWSKKYGDVIYMNMFGTPTIILNSLKAVSELLEKRSGNYADRPDMIMANDLMGWEWDFAHMRHSERWRQHRKIFHQYSQPRAVTSYQQVQRKATQKLLKRLVESSDRFISHVRNQSGSIILRLVYGYKIQPENDHYVELANEEVRGLGLAVHSGSFLVDYLPFLQYIPAWIPDAGFQKIAERWKVATNTLKNEPFEIAKKELEQGISVASFVTENLEKFRRNSDDHISEEVVKNSAGIAYIAGSDSTVSVILTWMLAMIHYPEVFARAQAEIDSVVGKSRLPDFQDRESLPYLEAMLSETLRWQSVAPLAIPHRSSAEDIYEGYHIPKGVVEHVRLHSDGDQLLYTRSNFGTQHLDLRAIMRDETLYPEPDNSFLSDFLHKVENRYPLIPSLLVYLGMGAEFVPEACFDISKPVGPDGKPFLPPIEYTGGVIVHPKPFQSPSLYGLPKLFSLLIAWNNKPEHTEGISRVILDNPLCYRSIYWSLRTTMNMKCYI